MDLADAISADNLHSRDAPEKITPAGATATGTEAKHDPSRLRRGDGASKSDMRSGARKYVILGT